MKIGLNMLQVLPGILKIDVDLFLKTLPVMLKGMLGIFAVTVIIIVAMVLLTLLTAHKKKNDEK